MYDDISPPIKCSPNPKLLYIKQTNLKLEHSSNSKFHLYLLLHFQPTPPPPLPYLAIMDAFKGKFERTSADNYEEFLKVTSELSSRLCTNRSVVLRLNDFL